MELRSGPFAFPSAQIPDFSALALTDPIGRLAEIQNAISAFGLTGGFPAVSWRGSKDPGREMGIVDEMLPLVRAELGRLNPRSASPQELVLASSVLIDLNA